MCELVGVGFERVRGCVQRVERIQVWVCMCVGVCRDVPRVRVCECTCVSVCVCERGRSHMLGVVKSENTDFSFSPPVSRSCFP